MSEKDSKDIKVERNPKINIQQADPSLPPSEPKPAGLGSEGGKDGSAC